jgi:hypothetical protein
LSRTICLNETKGSSLFRPEPDFHVLIFMICRETEHLGRFLKSDFAIIYYRIAVESEEKPPSDQRMRESTNEAGSVSRAPK